MPIQYPESEPEEPIKRFSTEARAILLKEAWRGEISELQGRTIEQIEALGYPLNTHRFNPELYKQASIRSEAIIIDNTRSFGIYDQQSWDDLPEALERFNKKLNITGVKAIIGKAAD